MTTPSVTVEQMLTDLTTIGALEFSQYDEDDGKGGYDIVHVATLRYPTTDSDGYGEKSIEGVSAVDALRELHRQVCWTEYKEAEYAAHD